MGYNTKEIVKLLGKKWRYCYKIEQFESEENAFLLSIQSQNYRLLKYVLHNSSENISFINDQEEYIDTFYVFSHRGKTWDILMSYGANMGHENLLDFISKYRMLVARDENVTHLPPTYYDKIFLLGYDLNYEKIVKIFRKHHPNYTNDQALEEYKKELEHLKTIVLCNQPKQTLFNVLLFKRNKMATFSNNKNLVQIFKKCQKDFEIKFPHYGLILNYRMIKGMTRSRFINTAIDILQLILAYRLPEKCSEWIFQFFNENELRNFNSHDWKLLNLSEISEN